MIRDIIHIDESKCDGCGLCVPACHEGAIRIVNGKARVVADVLCDGMGACLGHCPRGAITVEHREAPAFDEAAVQQHLAALSRQNIATFSKQAVAAVHQAKFAGGPEHHNGGPEHHAGCPGSRLQTFTRLPTAPATSSEPRPQGSGLGEARRHGGTEARRQEGTEARRGGDAEARDSADLDTAPTSSELTHWPVQLRLLPPQAPVLRGASLLIAADCVPVAYADFQTRMLRGRAVLIGCPKFDDLAAYVEKLTQIIAHNELQEILVARMEVPCCSGILAAVLEARRRAGVNVPVRDAVVGVQGEIRLERDMPIEAAQVSRNSAIQTWP